VLNGRFKWIGFGIVFSGETVGKLRAADASSYRGIAAVKRLACLADQQCKRLDR
jgi:hypothetical protein